MDTSGDRYSTAARLTRNSAFIFLARLTDLTVAIASIALIARYLGVVDFGYFAFVTAITIFLVPFTDFGFERIITREIAGDRALADSYFGSAVLARLFLSVVIIALIFAVTRVFGWEGQIAHAVYISTFAQLFFSMGMLAVGTFRAFERMEYELLLNFVFNIVYILLIVAVVRFDLGFLSIFTARLVASILHMTVLMIIAVWKFVRPVLRPNPGLITYLFKEALPLGIFALLLTASFKVDVFVLNHFRGPEEVSIFEAGHKIIMQLQVFPTSIVIALFPLFSRLEKQDAESLRSSFNTSFKFMLIAGLPVPLLLVFASDPIISSLYGAGFIDASSVLKILSLTIPFLFLLSVQSFVLTSKGRQGLNTASVAVCFALNLALDMVLAPRYGYLGVSWATLASYTVFFFISFFFISRTTGAPPVGRILPKPLLGVGLLWAAVSLLDIKGGLLLTALGCVVIMALYVIIIVLLKTFDHEEVQVIKRLVYRRRFQGKGP